MRSILEVGSEQLRIFYNKFTGGGLLIITLIFYNVSIGCNLVDGAKPV